MVTELVPLSADGKGARYMVLTATAPSAAAADDLLQNGLVALKAMGIYGRVRSYILVVDPRTPYHAAVSIHLRTDGLPMAVSVELPSIYLN